MAGPDREVNRAMFNVLDLVILVGLMAILGAAFFNGVSRTMSSVVAVYFAAICAGAFYVDVTELVQRSVAIGTSTGHLIFFSSLLLGFSLVFTFVISRFIEGWRMPRWLVRLAVFDTIGGAALGLLVAGTAVTVAGMFLSIMVQAMHQVALQGGGPLADLLATQIRGSSLVPFFLKVAPFFINLVQPWFPGGLPDLLRHVT